MKCKNCEHCYETSMAEQVCAPAEWGDSERYLVCDIDHWEIDRLIFENYDIECCKFYKERNE